MPGKHIIGPGLLGIKDRLGRENPIFCQILSHQFQVCLCFVKSNQIIRFCFFQLAYDIYSSILRFSQKKNLLQTLPPSEEVLQIGVYLFSESGRKLTPTGSVHQGQVRARKVLGSSLPSHS